MEDKRKIIAITAAVVALIIALAAAYTVGYRKGYSAGQADAKVVTKIKEVKLPAEVKTETLTEIRYVEKATDQETGRPEKTDMEVTIPKTEFHVKVNGQEQVIKKSDSEKQVFEKNKITLDQKSTAAVEIKVPTIDNTRKWSVGVGYGNHGLAGKVDFPIRKPVSGWIYCDKNTAATGVQVNF